MLWSFSFVHLCFFEFDSSGDAKTEATRDGSIPIDLVDGRMLVVLLKKLGLGIKIEQLEEITIQKGWYEAFQWSARAMRAAPRQE